MINTDDVIRKIITQAQSALNETNEKKKAAYLYSIQTLAELASEGETPDTQATSAPQPSMNQTTNSRAEALELQKMMGDMYQPNTPRSVQSEEDDQFEQGSGSLLDF